MGPLGDMHVDEAKDNPDEARRKDVLDGPFEVDEDLASLCDTLCSTCKHRRIGGKISRYLLTVDAKLSSIDTRVR